MDRWWEIDMNIVIIGGDILSLISYTHIHEAEARGTENSNKQMPQQNMEHPEAFLVSFLN